MHGVVAEALAALTQTLTSSLTRLIYSVRVGMRPKDSPTHRLWSPQIMPAQEHTNAVCTDGLSIPVAQLHSRSLPQRC